MAKNFRLHSGVDIVDWSTTAAYGKHAIDLIQDPTGANASREITSIPSPFARIDLTRAAFDNVAHGDLVGKTIYHKIVSDSLDVAELFFNIDKHAEVFDIVAWDSKSDLQTLLDSPLTEHRLLGETLQTYLLQDAESYNFGKLQCVYMLLYTAGGPDAINIVGGTSPASLFFSSANDLSYINIKFGNDSVFDGQYAPLHLRDFEFVKFLFALAKSIHDFSILFPSVANYLDKTLAMLTAAQRAQLQALGSADYATMYDKLTVTGAAGREVEILGHALLKQKSNTQSIAQVSDFVIQPLSKSLRQTPPLVLPNSVYNAQLKYTSHPWPNDGSILVPFEDCVPLEQRQLPGVGDRYPYLTVGDIFEPYLIQTVYPIDSARFFTGNPKGFEPTECSYLLPLKKEIFDYFSTHEVQGYVHGEQFIDISKAAAGAVKVTVRIPIKCNRNITFERIYYPELSATKCAEADPSRNKGAIVKQAFSLAVYPFIKVEQGNNFYRVAMIDRDVLAHNKGNKHTLSFNDSQRNNKSIKVDAVQARSQKSDPKVLVNTDYYVLSDGFDYIELQNTFARGVILPIFPVDSKGSTSFSFAVDFGTTNTHIEYQAGNQAVKPLDITISDQQIATLHDPSQLEALGSHQILHRVIEQELLPLQLGDQEQGAMGAFRFPVRTAITYKDGLPFAQSTYAMADLNMSFLYEKVHLFRNQSLSTNLKWSNFTLEADAERRIEAYFESILLLVRNKILFNGGDIDTTHLVWFYPASMSVGRRKKLEGLWLKLYKKYITEGPNNQPRAVSESVAPFYYYKNQKGVAASDRSVVSIDIGGGTTDMVIFERNEPRYQTSVRFAANAVFGDGYGCSPAINGFVQKYLHRITELLAQNKERVAELSEVLKEITLSNRSEDIIAFFFSIENHNKVREHNLPISFNQMLGSDDHMRVVCLVFYSSLIFHLAKLMHVKELKAPSDITFSGTGSKILSVVDPSSSLGLLSKLTAMIFDQVMGTLGSSITLHPNENPKEVTCKGGLLMPSDHQLADYQPKNEIFIASSVDPKEQTYDTIEGVSEAVIADFQQFLDILAQCHKTFNFNDNFITTPASMGLVTEVLMSKAKQHLSTGIQAKQGELGKDTNVPIEEAPFFYILTGGLNELAYKAAELK